MTQSPKDFDKPQCNCGVVGVFNHPQAAVMTYYALHALQHRGQEAAGIVAANFSEEKNRTVFSDYKAPGLVLDVFADSDILTKHLRGNRSVGHNRYSTTGSMTSANIQPFLIKYRMGNLALAHNGNLTNTKTLREALQNDGAIFQSTTDSELFLHLIARSRKETQLEQIREALRITRGAYSLAVLTDEALYVARDPHGFRPLAVGRIRNDDGYYAYIAASETCAFDIINAEFVCDVKHNEILVIDRNTVETGEIRSYPIDDVTPVARQCVFEYVYFSRPDSRIFGHSVDKVRRKLGKALAEEHPVYPEVEGDRVRTIPVPDSANTAALGYADQSQKMGVPNKYEIGLIRSHYVGRTFIAPGQNNREMKVKVKFNPVEGVIKDRQVVLIDDSIVRGTTSRSLVRLIRGAGPKEVHMRISSPPVTHPCKYGMDFPSREELIANNYECDADKIGAAIEVDTLAYLSVEQLMKNVPQDEGVSYCNACFTGSYPVEIDLSAVKHFTED